MSSYDHNIAEMVGAHVKQIFMDSEFLVFSTDRGDYSFGVEGDCCSNSYFYDIIGVKNLLAGGEILEACAVSLDGDPRGEVVNGDYEEIECYGFKIVSRHPEFGPVTTVFSFRNSSNGYYGGWMYRVQPGKTPAKLPEITDDVTEVQ